MSFRTVACPLCSRPSLVLVLFADSTKACCENCLSNAPGAAEAAGVVFSPEQLPDGSWICGNDAEGYVVFVFKGRNMAALDCPKVGNALYVMEANKWKFLSQMSKTELLRFHREEIRRVVHYSYWLSDLNYILRQSS